MQGLLVVWLIIATVALLALTQAVYKLRREIKTMAIAMGQGGSAQVASCSRFGLPSFTKWIWRELLQAFGTLPIRSICSYESLMFLHMLSVMSAISSPLASHTAG